MSDPPKMGESSSSSSENRSYGRQRSLSEEDESVMIAVRALDDMRSRAMSSFNPYSAYPSSQPTPALSTSTSPSIASQHLMSEGLGSPDFVSRVSGLPIVNTALRAYEQSKASSRVVKYGAEMMESSVKSISRPVIDRLPVNQIDEFACRQLDRIGRYGRSGQESSSSEHRRTGSSVERDKLRENWQHGLQMRGEAFSGSAGTSREPSPDRSENDSASQGDGRLVEQQHQDVANRSRWQALLLEAGGIGAAVSVESMRRLKYCLQWLQYATEHIDAQILVLRNFITSLSSQRDSTDEDTISTSHLQTLTDVKRDVVNTIRQVVDVVSKYAGGALPDPARARVRQFILHLPQRWATTQRRTQAQVQTGTETPVPSRKRRGSVDTEAQMPGAKYKKNAATDKSACSLSSTSVIEREDADETAISTTAAASTQTGTGRRPTAIAATQAAHRIMTLATESLDMMRSVTGVFKESLDRAEAWTERLRFVGIQRQQQRQGENSSEGEDPMVASADLHPWQPPTADSAWVAPDAPSPAGVTTSSLSALTLSSTYATPLSRVSSLPSISNVGWDYSRRRGQSASDLNQDEDEARGDQRTGVSAIRGTVDGQTSRMDIDG